MKGSYYAFIARCVICIFITIIQPHSGADLTGKCEEPESVSSEARRKECSDGPVRRLAPTHSSIARISKPAPNWESTAVINGQVTTLRLSDFRGKYLVLLFYPSDFTFVCPTEIIAFSDRIEEFHSINAEVVACSVDSHFTHLAWINTPRKLGGLGPVRIALLSDPTHQISKNYGVLLDDQGLSLRGLFITDEQGVLRQVTVNDLPVGRSVDETLRLVQALQQAGKHGEVCPADWKPGSDTINPEEALRSRWPKQEL